MSSSATLVFGLSVDPFKLLYQARAWSENQIQLAYLDGLIDGKLVQDSSLPYSLPHEVLSMIKQRYWASALSQASCHAWALFGSPVTAEVKALHTCADAITHAYSILESDEGCDGDCGYPSANGGQLDVKYHFHSEQMCLDLRLQYREWAMIDDMQAAGFSRDEYYEEERRAKWILIECFAKDPCKEDCDRCRVSRKKYMPTQADWLVQVLHPFLKRNKLEIVHAATNVMADWYDEELWACVLSVCCAHETSAGHDHRGGSETSCSVIDFDQLAVTAQAASVLQDLAKRLELPVIDHPFRMSGNPRFMAKKGTGRSKRDQKMEIPMAELQKPRFYLLSESYCEQ